MREFDFEKRKRAKRLLGSRALVVILVLLVVVLGRATWSVAQKEKATSNTLVDVQSREADLEDQKLFFESEIERLQTEEGIEEEVRDRYGLARSDEKVVILVDEDSDEDGGSTRRGWWSTIKGWFR